MEDLLDMLINGASDGDRAANKAAAEALDRRKAEADARENDPNRDRSIEVTVTFGRSNGGVMMATWGHHKTGNRRWYHRDEGTPAAGFTPRQGERWVCRAEPVPTTEWRGPSRWELHPIRKAE
jgi:hypothetical protein